MAGLNKAQKLAVETQRGPLLVLAGAGTGKTRVVTFRIANLIRHGIQPDRILAVTFTNKAAGEMRQRIKELLKSKSRKSLPLVSTFHSLCVRILRQHITHLGYPENFTICNRGDQESIGRQSLRDINAVEAQLSPSQLVSQISNWKSRSIHPAKAAQIAESEKEGLAAAAYRRYQKKLKIQGSVDFDDLLLLTEELFRKHPTIKDQVAAKFDHILVDEYQDTNASQYRIVKDLAAKHQNLCVVGDDDQSIYGFRGAQVEHILNFGRDWPAAKVVNLEENYRSTGPIIRLANELITFNLQRHDKTLRSGRPTGPKPAFLQFPNETKEAKEIVYLIRNRLSQPGVEAGDIAILFRTKEQPRPFETELRKANLPYVLIGGMSFFDRKEIKDITAFLRLAQNPKDEMSLRRIANTPPRGLGTKVIETLIQHAVSEKRELWSLFANPERRPQISKAAHQGMDDLFHLITGLKGDTLVDQVRWLIDKARYQRELERVYPEPEDRDVRWNNVQQIVNSLGAFEQENENPSLSDFIDQLTLDDRFASQEKDKQLGRNAIALMTLHSAKGLEFPRGLPSGHGRRHLAPLPQLG